MSSEKLNFNIGNFTDKYLSEREQYLRQKSRIKVFTFDEVKDFVLKQQVPDEIKVELINLLKKYPHAAYNNFIQNISKNIQVILDKRSEYLKSINPKAVKPPKEKVEIKFEDLKEYGLKESSSAQLTENSKEEEIPQKSIFEELKEELN